MNAREAYALVPYCVHIRKYKLLCAVCTYIYVCLFTK